MLKVFTPKGGFEKILSKLFSALYIIKSSNSIFISEARISARIFAITPSDLFISTPVHNISGMEVNTSTINEPQLHPKSAKVSFDCIFNKFTANSVIQFGVVPNILLISQLLLSNKRNAVS